METTYNNIDELVKGFDFNVLEQLKKHFEGYDYPVFIEHDDKAVTLKTDADRVPFTKVLRFPFTDDDLGEALTGILCVTDYAMHEGYWHTHADLFVNLALKYAEKNGIYEYKTNRNYMEYWSLYEDGFHFFRVDLDTDSKDEVGHIEWHKEDGIPVPAFLIGINGGTLYNYFCG